MWRKLHSRVFQTKQMDLKLVNPQAASLLEAYDIPLERRKILLSEIEIILKEIEGKALIMPMASIIDKVARPCQTEEELVCVVTAVIKRMLRKYNTISPQ